jgi:hypothetical protein
MTRSHLGCTCLAAFNPEEVGKPETLKGNRLIHSKPEGTNQYSQGPVER